MHEFPVTQSILEIALRYANAADARRITDIYLVIGSLSTMVDDSVQYYWDIISRGTLAEGARLHFQRIPMAMVCLECEQSYQPAPGELMCPFCGSQQVKITQGEEFRLESIAIEPTTPEPA